MRALVLLLALIVFGAGLVLVLDRQERADSRSIEGRTEPDTPKQNEELAEPEPVERKQPEAAEKTEEAAEWVRWRPASERLIADPDTIGPCPPAHLGGHPTRVIRRYKDPYNGFLTWVHEDGAVTQISFTSEKDSSGKKLSRRVILTSVPTKPKPIAPDDR